MWMMIILIMLIQMITNTEDFVIVVTVSLQTNSDEYTLKVNSLFD